MQNPSLLWRAIEKTATRSKPGTSAARRCQLGIKRRGGGAAASNLLLGAPAPARVDEASKATDIGCSEPRASGGSEELRSMGRLVYRRDAVSPPHDNHTQPENKAQDEELLWWRYPPNHLVARICDYGSCEILIRRRVKEQADRGRLLSRIYSAQMGRCKAEETST